MQILIIEDEPQAVQWIERAVKELVPDAVIVGKLDSIKRSVQWLKQQPSPDVILLDIQLADGISFEIFEQCEVKAPVIFTTAFDGYAIQAFKVNGIDYILKPVDKQELAVALEKAKKKKQAVNDSAVLLQNIGSAMKMLTKKYKSRFVIKVGEHIRTIETDTVLFFYSQEKTTFCTTTDNRNHILDYTLEQLAEMVDPERYFRVNRKYLVCSSAINDIIHYSNSRLRLVLKNSQDNDVIVSREKVQEFKSWLDS